ncbi:ribose 5-phosphate isomerase B [Candidatus Desantisbacteria bacterium]|nr:ribose 5-phosphate isomerase B [Candidatus Desantisbacteria bacterium]
MKIALGADHAGYKLKEEIVEHLKKGDHKEGYEVMDCGTDNGKDPVDYPDFGIKVAQAVRDGVYRYGILICGTGVGMSITANKIHGIRAALCHTVQMAELCREHNDANILVLGARVIEPQVAIEMVDVFLTTDFAGNRHERRIGKITQLEKTGDKVIR